MLVLSTPAFYLIDGGYRGEWDSRVYNVSMERYIVE
jgi:hypothetical protein